MRRWLSADPFRRVPGPIPRMTFAPSTAPPLPTFAPRLARPLTRSPGSAPETTPHAGSAERAADHDVLVLRATRLGLPDETASMSSVILAARNNWEESDRRRAMRRSVTERRRPVQAASPARTTTQAAAWAEDGCLLLGRFRKPGARAHQPDTGDRQVAYEESFGAPAYR